MYRIDSIADYGRGGRSPDEAFQLPGRASQRENRKLRGIAVEIVEGVSRRGGAAAV